MNPYLTKTLDFLEDILPASPETLTNTGGCRFRTETAGSYTFCTVCFPWLSEDGKRINAETLAGGSHAVNLNIVFAYDSSMKLCADLSAYTFSARDMDNTAVQDYLENESDWLFWETDILRSLYGEEMKHIHNGIICVYGSAYTTKAVRRRGLFRSCSEQLDRFLSDIYGSVTLYTAMSLDPDVACYGEDKTDRPYIYSMRDEPARLLNAEIVRRLGFTPLRLETSEPVEDGSLLWFACRKTVYQMI